MDFDFYRPSIESPELLLQCLVGLALFIIGVIFLNYKYKWFLKMHRLKEEMEYLELNQNEENVLTGMIKRYRLNEPVDMLLSLPLFDELAKKEMYRVLQGVGTSKAKEMYIEMVYDIRQRTFYPELEQQNKNIQTPDHAM